jgi:hypothetical protein
MPYTQADIEALKKAIVTAAAKVLGRPRSYGLLHPRLLFGQIRAPGGSRPIIGGARLAAIVGKSRIEACLATVVKSNEQMASIGAGSRSDANGRVIEEIRPGSVSYPKNGEEVAFGQPTNSGHYEQVWLASLRPWAAPANPATRSAATCARRMTRA